MTLKSERSPCSLTKLTGTVSALVRRDSCMPSSSPIWLLELRTSLVMFSAKLLYSDISFYLSV